MYYNPRIEKLEATLIYIRQWSEIRRIIDNGRWHHYAAKACHILRHLSELRKLNHLIIVGPDLIPKRCTNCFSKYIDFRSDRPMSQTMSTTTGVVIMFTVLIYGKQSKMARDFLIIKIDVDLYGKFSLTLIGWTKSATK